MEEKKLYAMPMYCPKCGNLMKTKLDQKMWAINQMCLKCTVKMEGAIRARGKEAWAKYEEEKIEANMLSYLKQEKQQVKEYISGLEKIEYLQNSAGDIEKWDIDPKQIQIVKERYEKYFQQVDNYINKMKENKKEDEKDYKK